MKILIASFSFPPNKDGVSEAASTMAQGFVEHGHEVSVLTEQTQPKRVSSTWDGIKIIQYSQTEELNPEVWLGETTSSYSQLLHSGSWDVVIFHSYTRQLEPMLAVLARTPTKTILVSHGYAVLIWEKSPEFPYGIYRLIQRFIQSLRMIRWMRNCDRIVYLSNQTDFLGFYDHLIAKLTRHQGRRVIPNGVDPDEKCASPDTLRVELGIEANAFLIVCVANYSARKDQGFGAKAFRKAAVPRSVLVFIGSEFNEHSLQFQKEDECHNKDRASGRIIWLEKKTRDFALNAISACDAFLLSSYHEAQPIVLLEAMRESKPWIARKAGCIPEMPGGICVSSVAEMSLQMVKLATQPELRASLGNEGRAAIDKTYNRKHYVDSYCALVADLIKR